MRQRGSILLYGLIALAILGALGGIYASGYSAGKDSKQAEWDQANREAQAKADDERRKREAAVRAASQALQAAQRDASAYRARWNAERAKQPVLASCGPAEPLAKPEGGAGSVPAPVRGQDATKPAPDGGMRLILTREFVRLYDLAWTGADGKPVFGDSSGSADSTSTASPAELLTAHEENASRCSAATRQLNRLIDLLEKLRAG